MGLPTRFLILSCVAIAGCTATRNVAVSTFRVLDTPARYVRERIDPPVTTTTTTTTTRTGNAAVSDVARPGRPVNVPPPSGPRTGASTRSSGAPPPTSSSGSTATVSPQRKPVVAATPRPSASPKTQFPTAKPVPDRPGYVYSIDPKGGIVDVTGYKSGDKAKDPYTQQIFIVP